MNFLLISAIQTFWFFYFLILVYIFISFGFCIFLVFFLIRYLEFGYICFSSHPIAYSIVSRPNLGYNYYYKGRSKTAEKPFCRLCERQGFKLCRDLKLGCYPNLVPEYPIYWIWCREHLRRGYDFSYKICRIYRGLSNNNLAISAYRREVVLNGVDFMVVYLDPLGNILVRRFLDIVNNLDKNGKFKFLTHIATPEQGGCYLLHGQNIFIIPTYSEFKRLSPFLLKRITPQEVSLLGSLVILEKLNIIEKEPAKLVSCIECNTKYFETGRCLVCFKIPQ